MNIEYKKIPENLEYIKSYIDCFIEDLELRPVFPLHIQVETAFLFAPDQFGYVESIRGDYSWFKVVLNRDFKHNKTKKDLVSNVAHEFRHIWQKVNDIEHCRDTYTIPNVNCYTDAQWNVYYHQPSEVDARQYAEQKSFFYFKVETS